MFDSPRSRVFAGRALLPLVLALLLVGAVDHHLQSVQGWQMEADLRDDSDRVSSLLRGRLESNLHLLGAVEATVRSEADHHPALGESVPWDKALVRGFDVFGGVLLGPGGWRDVRAVAYIDPAGVVRWVYPLENNERAMGHRLLDSPEVAPFVRKAIETRRPVASDPYILVQGGLGTVVRSPIYLGERLLGLSAVVVDMDVLFRETLPSASVPGPVVWVSDRLGNIVWTNRQVAPAGSRVRVEHVDGLSLQVGTPLYPASIFEAPLPVARSVIPVADSIWVLHMAPGGVSPVFLWSRAAVALLVSLLCLSLFSLFRTWRRLDGERRRASRSEETLSSIVGSSPDAIITCDTGGSIRSWNPGAQALFGYTALEMVGQSVKALVPPESQGLCTRILEQAAPNGGSPRVPPVAMEMLRRDGSRVPVEVALAPLVGLEWSGFVAVVRDVSEMRALTGALRDSQRRLESILGSLDDVVWSVSAGDRRLVYLSPASGRVHGRPNSDFFEDPDLWFKVVHPEDRGAVEAFRDFLWRTGGAAEYRVLRPDGSVRWLYNRAHVVRDAGGAPVRLDGIATDITERKQAEGALRESEERFRLLVENIPQVFWMANPDMTRINYISPAYEEVWGRSRESLYANPRSWLESLHPEDRERVLRDTLAHQTRGEFEKDYRIVRGDGSIRWIRDHSLPIRDSAGNVSRIVGICMDITERKQLEVQLLQSAKMAAVGQLAGGVAHELNNPLMAVLVYSERLQQKLSALKLQPGHVSWAADLERIAQAASRCERIVRALRTFSRQEDQRSTTVDLNQVIRSTLELLTYMVSRVRLSLDLSEDLPAFQGNPVALQQVFTNLVVNAVEALPPGGELSISTRRVDGRLEARVSDTGTGIFPENLKRLFEPFFTTKPPGKGTGLGLSISQRILRDHGGHIEAQSEPGKGTTFTVSIPLDASLPSPATPAVSPAPAT